MNIKLNCDMGESFGIWKMGLDEEIMPYVDMANLACGFHASDALTMQKSVRLACENDVEIGVHPGYPDISGFGRRSMNCSFEEIETLVLYQMGALSAFCKANGTAFTYVKPHGALYNDMMKNEMVFKAILTAISSYDKSLKLMILSTSKGEKYEKVANSFGIELLFEVFADRNYNKDGTLVSRTFEHAVIHEIDVVLNRIKTLKNEGYLVSHSGEKLYIKSDVICVHGDNQEALEFIKTLRGCL